MARKPNNITFGLIFVLFVSFKLLIMIPDVYGRFYSLAYNLFENLSNKQNVLFFGLQKIALNKVERPPTIWTG